MYTKHARILVIDDEPETLEVLSLLLKQQGFDLLFASDGASGVQQAMSDQPDLILLDVIMPGLDGFETCRELKTSEQTKAIPVIFMTALSETDEKVKGFECGAVDYLAKPFAPEEVLVRVNTHLGRQQLAKDLHTQMQALVEQHTAIARQMNAWQLHLSQTLPHELRTPLNAILGFSRLLMSFDQEQWSAPDTMLPLRTAMYQSALRLQRLIENYLLYAELRLLVENSEQRPQNLWQSTETFRAAPVITYYARAKAEKARRQEDLRLTLVEAEIQISEKSLQKIVDELLDNALKFSEPGTPVQISTEVNSSHWFLRITDQGRGMKAEQIANIGAFIQFEREWYEQQGSGLGLTIARLLAQLNGGKLTIESVPYQGTTVTVMFKRL